jgi:PAS domain-containing protein
VKERRFDVSGVIQLPVEAAARSPGGLVAWISFLLAVLMYLAWWPVFLHLVPGAVDPPGERIALVSMCALFLILGGLPRFRRHIIRFSHVALYLTTLHFFSLLWRNYLAAPYLAAAFVFLAAVTLSFFTLRPLLAYVACVLLSTAAIALFSPAHGDGVVLLVAGVISAVMMMSALSWRNVSLQQAARNKVRAARDLLRGLVTAIPDPVFVLDDRQRCLLVNDAMTSLEGIPLVEGAGLPARLRETLADDLDRALRSEQAIEREIPLFRAGAPSGTALAKLSSRELGGTRYLIGVIRDITVRKSLEESLEARIQELQTARAKVSQLQGLLPICMHCGRIRGGDGDWQDLERYVESHSGAVFSHGLCSSCLATHYPE